KRHGDTGLLRGPSGSVLEEGMWPSIGVATPDHTDARTDARTDACTAASRPACGLWGQAVGPRGCRRGRRRW
ncbi:MAG: hypothetical protein V3T11_03690, partial [Roseateles sp.]